MASPHQQQSLRRKIIYIAVIVVLAFGTYVLRENSRFGLRAQAEDLQIQEHNLGEVELTGSAVRLTLTGSRGLAMCVLWLAAIEKQTKHEWNELELLVNSVTKLQPHFITPWLFQSWNLAYNVSVESDLVRDKYFYITRGIELLAGGEKQNKNHPDLRWYMGFMNQHKIGLADEGNYLRCLYQMSCIDPVQRDPARLRKTDTRNQRVVDTAAFEQFCRAHPMLVRRLREGLKKETPGDVVDFFEENQKIPSRYEDAVAEAGAGQPRSRLKAESKQFPVQAPGDGQTDHGDPDDADYDNFTCARDWYYYAVKPLPPPEDRLTGENPSYDRTKYRMPRYMASLIFRGYPARGQTYIAEYLEKAGWFDAEGWKITGDWFPEDRFSDGKASVVGDGVSWAVRAWSKAFSLWQDIGKRTGQYLEPEELANLERQAQLYRQKFSVIGGDQGPDLRGADRQDQALRASQNAHRLLHWYHHYRMMTNFAHFYYNSQVEQEPQTVQVRKTFFKAEQLRKAGDREQALELYRQALPRWREILLAHRDFRRDDTVQEDSYELEVRYLELVRDLHGENQKKILVIGDLLAQGAVRPPLGTVPLLPPLAARDVLPEASEPLAGVDNEGEPIIGKGAKMRIRERLHLPYQLNEPPAEGTESAPPPSAIPTPGGRSPVPAAGPGQ